MFTGIIEEIGQIKNFKKYSHGAKITIQCEKVLCETNPGDSISVNGCCQTVVDQGKDYFTADISDETLKVTNLANIKNGAYVNLERALTLQSRLGGHIVQGHIDCTGKFVRVVEISGFYNMTFEVPKYIKKYLVKKGSIAVNGISLTIAEIQDNRFDIAVIPRTYKDTNLQYLCKNEIVNIETDILGKYIENFLSLGDNDGTLNEDFLKENGFI